MNRIKAFASGVKTQFTKIVWPGRDTLFMEFLIVSVSVILLGLVISGIDFVIQYALNLIFSI